MPRKTAEATWPLKTLFTRCGSVEYQKVGSRVFARAFFFNHDDFKRESGGLSG